MEKRLPSLDGWRAIAIILVLGSHLCFTPDCPPLVARWAWEIFDGNLGVRGFFTISGFIITWLLLDEQAKTGTVSLRDFYWRRGLRILPVYLSYLLAVLSLQGLGEYHETASSWLGSLTFSRNLIGRGDSPTVHFWSLAIEEQFYLLWPVTFVVMRLPDRRKLFYLLAAGLVAGAILARSQEISNPATSLVDRMNGPRSAFRYADCIVIGCVAAFVNSPRLRQVPLVLELCGYAGLFSVSLCNIMGVGFPATAQPFLPTFQATCFAVVMVASISSPGLVAKILNHRLLVRIGLLSYSLYVWHVLFSLSRLPLKEPWNILNRWYFWIFPATLISMLSWRFIEQPVRVFKASNPFMRRKPASPTLTAVVQ